jgi:hypothetical protein
MQLPHSCPPEDEDEPCERFFRSNLASIMRHYLLPLTERILTEKTVFCFCLGERRSLSETFPMKDLSILAASLGVFPSTCNHATPFRT